jgi:hypothetical protein
MRGKKVKQLRQFLVESVPNELRSARLFRQVKEGYKKLPGKMRNHFRKHLFIKLPQTRKLRDGSKIKFLGGEQNGSLQR